MDIQRYTSAEIFAGAGGLALGLEKAGFKAVFINEIDKNACETLRTNKPEWPVIEGDIKAIDFTPYRRKVDLLSGGFPCQAFSVVGRQLGFEDTRGTLFFEYARAIKEIQPKVFIAENVKGLMQHSNGETLQAIINVINELGYTLIDTRLLNAVNYRVPQKRERLFLIGIRNDLLKAKESFSWPEPGPDIYTLKDALKAGRLYESDVKPCEHHNYCQRKKEILSMVPPVETGVLYR